MNVRNHLIEIQCAQRDVNDVAQALVHSLIFFRTHGKFNYKHEGSYSIGTLGFERAFCDHFDFTYVRCSSLALVTRINNKVQEFADRINESTHSGTITLEFYQKRQNRWPFNDSKIVWDQWNIKITLAGSKLNQLLQVSPSPPPVPASLLSPSATAQPAPNSAAMDQYNSSALGSTQQHQRTTSGSSNHNNKLDHSNQTRLEDLLSQKLLDIIRLVNSDKCSVPQMPTQPNLDTVFDTSLSDLQPYLYNISFKISETAPGSQPAIGGPPGALTGGYAGGGSAGGAGATKSNEVDGTAQSSIKKFLLGTLEL